MAQLRASISAVGVREAVLLGDDWRVWDGHHRLVAARQVGWAGPIPVEYGHSGPGGALNCSTSSPPSLR